MSLIDESSTDTAAATLDDGVADAKMSSTDRKLAAIALATGLLVRLAAALLLPDQGMPDAAVLRSSALNLWSTGQLGASHIMPLYPLLVGLVGPGVGQLALDVALSTAAVGLIYVLTLTMFSDRLAAFLAAMGTALYPNLIFFAVLGLTEPLYIALVLSAFIAWYRGAFAAAAVFVTLSILTRPSIDLLVPVLVLYFAMIIHRLPWKSAVLKLAAYAAIYCALMAPWWAHNFKAYGSFVRLNLASGEVFYLGNNPMNRSGGGIYGVDGDLTQFQASPDPVARNAAQWAAGLDYVRSNPGRFVEMAAVKFMRLWRPWPYAAEYSDWRYVLVSAASFVPVAALALLYLLRWGIADRVRASPLFLFVGYITAVHMVTIASIRYRVPLEPFVIIFAAVAAARLLRRWPVGRKWIAAFDTAASLRA
jgi:4-amino-4-deoxy-L-arabinose transferase-like glycosyltransferase